MTEVRNSPKLSREWRRNAPAARFASPFHIGTAAWANPPFERDRRPAASSHLEYYATQFNAVEINSSFYRSHQRATYERWRDSTPAGFRFSVKFPRSVTHDCALRGAYRRQLDQFADEVSGLGEKLQVVLVQLPPSLAFEPGVAARFFKSLTAACDAQVACEPRHASWFSERAETVLCRHEVARVAADPAKAPGGQAPGGAKRLVYYRLHGSPKVYYSAYSASFLTQLTTRMKELSASTQTVWCIFDNTARHEAWRNALHTSQLLSTSFTAIHGKQR